jgi:hypothetical protein
MLTRHFPFPTRPFLMLALGGAMAACSSGTSTPPPEPDPDPLMGGRLIYSLDGVTDTLKMFDQTVADDRFASTTVAATAGAELVISNDGLTLAMLEQNGNLSVVSSGLEHLHDSDPHTHDVRIESAAPISNVSHVVATTDHFSILTTDGSGLLIEAADGEDSGHSWTDVVYPTLVLEGGQFLTFTANATNPADTDLTVVNADGSTGDSGLIFLRPNATGFFAESFTCAGGVVETAQTEHFTIALCGDGTLRWLGSGYVAPEGHPAAGQTIHVTQRYPATDTRREGATGEVTAGASAFVENISGLSATRSEDDVIVAWSEDQLWLINLHSDHPHRASVYESLPADPNLVAVASATVDDAVTVISDSGMSSTFRFIINESANPQVSGGVFSEQLDSGSATWSPENTHLASGAYDFLVVNRDTAILYHIDAHDPEDEYHLHASYGHADLSDARSAVFAHGDGHEHHDHDHDD